MHCDFIVKERVISLNISDSVRLNICKANFFQVMSSCYLL